MSYLSLAQPTAPDLRTGTDLGAFERQSSLTLGWLCTFLSILLLLLPSLIGPVSPAGFLAIWIFYAAIQPALVVRALPALGLLWLFPLMTLLSTFWSEATMLSARASFQYTLTVICVVIGAQATSSRQFISSMMCALIVIALLCLVVGRTAVDYMTGQDTFLGIFSSKNYLAFFLSLLLFSSAAIAIDRQQPLIFRTLSIAGFLGAIPLLVLTRSATSVVVSVFCLGLLAATFVFARMTPKWRALTIISVLSLVAYAVLVIFAVPDIFEFFITRVLGKDTTLTGRTYLWGKALVMIAQEPILGQGFQAFWRPEKLEARELWGAFQMKNQSGFHFHNTYLEVAVGLGYVGLGIFITTLLIVTGRVLAWYIHSLSVSSAFAVTVMACILVRSFVEIDVIFQFQLGTYLLFTFPVQAGIEAARRV